LIAAYDVFGRMAGFLDPHLMFPVLAFLGSLEVRTGVPKAD